MKPAFIEGQQQLFGCHDDTDHLITVVSQETTRSPASWSGEKEDDETSRLVDRYIDQGFNPIEARRMVFGALSVDSAFDVDPPIASAGATPGRRQRTQSGSWHNTTTTQRWHLSPKEQRARDALPFEVNER